MNAVYSIIAAWLLFKTLVVRIYAKSLANNCIVHRCAPLCKKSVRSVWILECKSREIAFLILKATRQGIWYDFYHEHKGTFILITTYCSIHKRQTLIASIHEMKVIHLYIYILNKSIYKLRKFPASKGVLHNHVWITCKWILIQWVSNNREKYYILSSTS